VRIVLPYDEIRPRVRFCEAWPCERVEAHFVLLAFVDTNNWRRASHASLVWDTSRQSNLRFDVMRPRYTFGHDLHDDRRLVVYHRSEHRRPLVLRFFTYRCVLVSFVELGNCILQWLLRVPVKWKEDWSDQTALPIHRPSKTHQTTSIAGYLHRRMVAITADPRPTATNHQTLPRQQE
jgi:hypothetical protein